MVKGKTRVSVLSIIPYSWRGKQTDEGIIFELKF